MPLETLLLGLPPFPASFSCKCCLQEWNKKRKLDKSQWLQYDLERAYYRLKTGRSITAVHQKALTKSTFWQRAAADKWVVRELAEKKQAATLKHVYDLNNA